MPWNMVKNNTESPQQIFIDNIQWAKNPTLECIKAKKGITISALCIFSVT